jgi:BirA family transcriptional regulator, biotin operon repressor / biotin---[acetyl-CoA-carboxylase] ligase
LHKLSGNDAFVGRRIIRLAECRSTNEEAAALIARGDAADGLVVMAGRQTAGKGQRGNEWESEADKNLILSVVFKAGFLDPADNFCLTVFSSLALCDLLEPLLPAPGGRIKWPNDIMAGGGKLAGILIENTIRGSRMEWTVIGIGLNVNQRRFTASGAVSLASISGRDYELESLAPDLFQHLGRRIGDLRRGAAAGLFDEYHRKLFWKGERHFFEAGGEVLEGQIEGVTPAGRLRLVTNGRLLSFDLKEIRFLG